MSHDVFVSYRRDDLEVCSQVLELIEKIGYIPYRDVDDFAAGDSWQKQRDDALSQTDPKPYVVVLCTRSAVEKPQGVVDELVLARRHELPLIPIEFDPGATKSLLTMAGYERPGQIQYVDAWSLSGRHVDERLEDALRRALTRKVRSWLEERRALARIWSERLHPAISFWDTTWRDYFPLDAPHGLSGSVALTARGGSGKSYLIAHCVRHLLDDPEVYPVLVEEAMLLDAENELARCLGARSAKELPARIEALAAHSPGESLGWKPMHVVFVVDGLDQMVTPGDVHQAGLVQGLNLLANSAPVLIGCRQEVWGDWYAGRVSVKAVEVGELDDLQVRDRLRRTPFGDQFNPLLQVPFFLDTALRKVSEWATLPQTETDFLHQIWSDALEEGTRGREVLSDDTGRAWTLENLAACQLEKLSYDVSLSELRRRPGYLPAYEKGRNELKKTVLVEQRRLNEPTFRLRHDLLDNHSMVRVLLSAPGDRSERLRALCRRCDKDCGWSLLASLVQAAHDWGDEALKRELFDQFLFILDHKPFGNEAMTRAWAVTHVLQNCFRPLFGLILEALAGCPVPNLDKNDPDHLDRQRSHLGSPAELTQAALSTVASAFLALQTGRLEDAELAVPVLARGLEVWPLKGRLLDALGKYRTEEALAAILSYGRRQMRDRDDLESLEYVAQNLRHFPRRETYELLREMIADTTLSPAIAKEAAKSLHHLLPGQVPVPLPDEGEILDGLKIRQKDGRYSDWRKVQRYAEHVRAQIAHGERFGPRVLEALIQALQHDQTFVRRSVAQTLALFDEREARDALLSEVLEPAMPAEVRSACLEALELQLRRLEGPRARQAFRYLLLRAAQVARHAGAVLTEQGLVELALKPELRKSDDWSLTQQALEVVPPANVPWDVRCAVKEAEPDPAVLRELQEVGLQNVGPDLEQKYLIADLKTDGSTLEISLAPTTWTLGKSFHKAIQSRPDRFLRDGGRWLEPVPLGTTRLPGLSVAHGIVRTSDGHLLMAQRAEDVSYAPLHWSASFEEQVTAEDMGEIDRVFHLAASRGMHEEFGVTVDPSRVHLVSFLLEMENLNLAAVVLFDVPETLEEIRKSWKEEPRPSHAAEAKEVDGIEADPAALEALAGGGESRLEPLHPTSRLRCALLARWLREGRALS